MKLLGKKIGIGTQGALLLQRPVAGLVQGLQMLRRRSSLPDRLFSDGYSPAPASIYIELTDRCNLRCTTCWLYGTNGVIKEEPDMMRKLKEKEMDTATIRRVIDDAAPYRPVIVFSGGEPLLRKDIFDLVGHAAKRGLFVSINSNGVSLKPGMERKLIDAGLSSLTVSIDGPEQANDTIRGEGTFEHAMEAIGRLIMARGSSSLPVVNIICTVTKDNCDKLTRLADVAAAAGVDHLRIQQQWFVDNGIYEQHRAVMKEEFGDDSTFLSGFLADKSPGIDVPKLVGEMDSLRKRSDIKVQFYPDLGGKELADYYDPANKFVRQHCYSPWFSLNVKPDGTASSCPAIFYEAGNLKEQSLMEVWNSDNQRKLRGRLVTKGLMPGCIRCCGLFS